MMLMWLVMNLAILSMVCLILTFLQDGFISITYTDNTYKAGRTNEKYPIIFSRFDCSGSETRLSSCISSDTTNIQYCSINQVIKLTCKGQNYLKYMYKMLAKSILLQNINKTFVVFNLH